jgi:hypothetical protein
VAAGICAKSGTPIASAAARHFCWSAKLSIVVVTPAPLAPVLPALFGRRSVMMIKVHISRLHREFVRWRAPCRTLPARSLNRRRARAADRDWL